MKKFIYLLIVVGSLLGLFAYSPHKVAAAFNANNLMDDGIFENSSSMSAAQIDAFLNGNPSSCISSNNGFMTPDPQGWQTNHYAFGGNVTAGRAIYDTAQLYHVNPQVILATMQKEQSLVTGSAGCHPNTPDPATATNSPCGSARTPCTIACQYAGGCMNIAMGYGCPNYCAAVDEGFSMQITLGTWLLRFGEQRAYGNLTGYVGYEQGDENFTYSGPMTQGQRKRSASSPLITYDGTYTTQNGVSVTIANGTTASLYNFTPFTSGNSNFDTIFQNWFGSIYVPAYSWQYQGQAVYTDSSKSVPVDSYNQALTPNTRYYFTLAALNTGNVTWQQGQIRLGTIRPGDRTSALYDSTWISPVRPATLLEASVAPGQVAHFEFWIKTPNSLYGGKEYFDLVNEGVAWFNDVGLNWVLNQPVFSWQYQGQSVYTDNTKQASVDSYNQALSPNTRYYFTLAALNTGNVTWRQGDVRLGTINPSDHNSILFDPSWLSAARPATMLESSVAPGQVAHFEFWVKTPNSLYGGKEYFNLLEEGVTWMNSRGLNWVLNTPKFTWSHQGQAVYTDSNKTTSIDFYNQHLAANTRYYFTLAALNTGNVTWQQGQVRLGTTRPGDRSSILYDSSWLSLTRPATMLEASVAPGQVAHFEFWVTTPNSYSGNEYFNLLDEGVIWMNDFGLNWVVNTP